MDVKHGDYRSYILSSDKTLVRMKYITISNWNMDTTSQKSVVHGLDHLKVL